MYILYQKFYSMISILRILQKDQEIQVNSSLFINLSNFVSIQDLIFLSCVILVVCYMSFIGYFLFQNSRIKRLGNIVIHSFLFQGYFQFAHFAILFVYDTYYLNSILLTYHPKRIIIIEASITSPVSLSSLTLLILPVRRSDRDHFVYGKIQNLQYFYSKAYQSFNYILIIQKFGSQMSKKPEKKSEVRQLQQKLLNPDLEVKLDGIRTIIDAMTRGKDVSMLFMDVLKNIQTTSLKLKKLIYLYVISYAKLHPDLAILGVNSFLKDAKDKQNPFLRGLAVRTMGCIRIKQITNYLSTALSSSLQDQDPYVRKTAALCVPKLYQIDPVLIQNSNLIANLEKLLNDGNATVVANTVVSLSILSEIKGTPMIKLTDMLVHKLLTAMNDCNQWGVIYILDALSTYIPKDSTQAQNIMERVSSRLAHTNSAVALSSIKLVIRYMDYLTNPQSVRAYNNKISSPLITMISRQNQISYIVLKTLNLVLQKRPLLLPKELKVFFVNYHDPLYVKLEKLEILVKIANNQNILLILHELKECIQQVDVEFVRKAVRTMGRCAIKLDKMADKCVQCLWETLKTKIPYVVQEAVIVIRDIFRKYPNKYQGLLADICQNLKSLDDPQAKASIVWIIGQYVEMIENADELMANFADNFKDQPDVVQQQILISCMKLYLHKPSEGQQILKDLFKYITKQCQNPDLRDRGFIYWRLLSTDQNLAKKIVLSERPLITDQSYTLETQLLDKLIENISTLSSVYGKQPEQFVKIIKDNANAQEEQEQQQQNLLGGNTANEKVQFFGNEKTVTYAITQQMVVDNKPVQNLLDVLQGPQMTQQSQIQKNQPLQQDLLGGTTETMSPKKTQSPKKSVQIDLLGGDDSTNMSRNYATSVPRNQQKQSSSQVFATQVHQQTNFFGQTNVEETKPTQVYQNMIIPPQQIINEQTTTVQGRYKGFNIKVAFQRRGSKMYLHLVFINNSQCQLTDVCIKFAPNPFKLAPIQGQLYELNNLKYGQMKESLIQLNTNNSDIQYDVSPAKIKVAIKILDDCLVFDVPCSLHVLFEPNFEKNIEKVYQLFKNPNKQNLVVQQIQNAHSLDQLIEKFQKNNLFVMSRAEKNETYEFLTLGCYIENKQAAGCNLIYNKLTKDIRAQFIASNQILCNLLYRAVYMLMSYA